MRYVVVLVSLLLATVFVIEGLSSVEEVSEPEVRTAQEAQTTEEPSASIPLYDWYPVVRVVDGDTLIVEIDGKDTTVRLIGLDTPETVDPRKPVECFGKEASDKAKQLMAGTFVRLEMDPSQGTLDKYGRTLAYVYVPASVRPEGILVNEYMIAEGYGHEYTYNLPYKYQARFEEAERLAREQKKGLWADRVCEDF